jgi:ribosome-binding protein aMBF1 (putative translation factor)
MTMPFRSESRKTNRTAEELSRLKEVRSRFQKQRPTHEQLIATGEYEGPLTREALISYLAALATLKHDRERLGLSLAQVSERSGLDVAFLSRLENGKIGNPTLATLSRYADALGRSIAIGLGETTR